MRTWVFRLLACLFVSSSLWCQTAYSPLRVNPRKPFQIYVVGLPKGQHLSLQVHCEKAKPEESLAKNLFHSGSRNRRYFPNQEIKPASIFDAPRVQSIYPGDASGFRFPGAFKPFTRIQETNLGNGLFRIDTWQEAKLNLGKGFERQGEPIAILGSGANPQSISLPPLKPGFYVLELLGEQRATYLPCLVSSLVLNMGGNGEDRWLKVIDAETEECLKDAVLWREIHNDKTGWTFEPEKPQPDGSFHWKDSNTNRNWVVRCREQVAYGEFHPSSYGNRSQGDRDASWSMLAYTERSMYRPGQEVFFRASGRKPSLKQNLELKDWASITRSPFWVLEDREQDEAPESIKPMERGLAFTVYNPEDDQNSENRIKGTALLVDPQTLGFAGRFQLPATTKAGSYRIGLQDSDGRETSIPFEVQDYEKPRFKVVFTDEGASSPIEKGKAEQDEAKGIIRIAFKAEALHGGPVPDGKVEWFLYEQQRRKDAFWWSDNPYRLEVVNGGEGRTNAQGLGTVELSANAIQAEVSYRLLVQVTDAGGQRRSAMRNLGKESTASSQIQMEVNHQILKAGESLKVEARVDGIEDPETTQAFKAESTHPLRIQLTQALPAKEGDSLWSGTEPWKAGAVEAEQVGTHVTFKPAPGLHLLRVRATLPSGEKVERMMPIFVVKPGQDLPPSTGLRAQLDEAHLRKTGRARILVLLPKAGLRLSWKNLQDTDSKTSKPALEDSEIVAGQTKLIEFPVPKALRPSAWLQLEVLTDADVQRTTVHLDTLEAESALEVQVRGPKEDQRPGATAQIQMKVRDHAGEKPRVSASVAVVDESIFQLAPEMLPDVLRSLHPVQPNPGEEEDGSILMGQGVVCEGFQQDFILHTRTEDRNPRPIGSSRIEPPTPGITTGTIRGAVTDKAGRPITGARVVLDSSALFHQRNHICDASGEYSARILPAGRYTVKVTATGFRAEGAHDVCIGAGNSHVLNFVLERAPDEAATTVEVVSDFAASAKTDDKVSVNYSAEQSMLMRGSDTGQIQYRVEGIDVRDTSNASALYCPLPDSPEDIQIVPKADVRLHQRALSALRQHFLDTALWIPHLEIKGSASVDVPLPDDLTRWRATVVAVTADGKAGVGRAWMKVNKPLQVNLVVPQHLTEGDETRAVVVLQNRSQQNQKGRVALQVEGGILEASGCAFDLKPGEERRIPFKLEAAKDSEQILLKAGAASKDEQDGELRHTVVHPSGVEYRIQGSLNLAGDAVRHTLTMPSDASGHIQFYGLGGGLEQLMAPSLGYLIRYPYGCVEQTLSSFMPNILVADLVKRGLMPPLKGAALESLDENIQKGVERVYGYQMENGGWGWYAPNDFGPSANPHTTGYAVHSLAAMKRMGYTVDGNRLDRGMERARTLLAECLLNVKNPDTQTAWRSRGDAAFLLACLAEAGDTNEHLDASLETMAEAVLNHTWDDSALLAQIALASTRLKHARMHALLNALEFRGLRKDGFVCWSSGSPFDYTYLSGDVYTTVVALRAFCLGRPHSDLIAKGEAFLASRFQGDGWNSTWATGQVVALLPDLARVRPIRWSGAPIHLAMEGGASFDLADAKPVSIPVAAGQSLNFIAKGQGQLIHLITTAANKPGSAPGVMPGTDDLKMRIQRQLWKLESPKTGQKSKGWMKKAWASDFKLGEEAYMEVQVQTAKWVSYGLVEVPIPAGFEAIPEMDNFVLEGEDLSLLPKEARMERHPDRIAFMMHWLGPDHPVTLRLRLRAKLEGRYRLRPAKFSLMGDENQWATSEGAQVNIASETPQNEREGVK